jgi:DNA-binding NtrC family response regulator
MTGYTVADITVLVVEDDLLIRTNIIDALEDDAFEVYEAENAASALETLHGNIGIQCLLTDVDLGNGMDGLSLASSVHGKWPDIGIIVVSGKSRVMPSDVPNAKFFIKPYDPEKIADMIRELVSADA